MSVPIIIGNYVNEYRLPAEECVEFPESCRLIATRLYLCPNCKDFRPAQLKGTNPWLCVCFIPVFPIRVDRRQFMLCAACDSEMDWKYYQENGVSNAQLVKENMYFANASPVMKSPMNGFAPEKN